MVATMVSNRSNTLIDLILLVLLIDLVLDLITNISYYTIAYEVRQFFDEFDATEA